MHDISSSEKLDYQSGLIKKIYELSTVMEISKEFISTLDAERINAVIVFNTMGVVGAKRGALFYLNPDQHELELCRAINFIHEPCILSSIKMTEKEWSHLREIVKPVFFSQLLESDFKFLEPLKCKGCIADPLIIPLHVKDNLMGLLVLAEKLGTPYSDDDIALLSSLANQSALALQNALSYRKMERLAEDLREILERERRIIIEKEKMEKYIPQAVIDEVHRSREEKLALGGKAQKCTIMFTDIRNFTRLSENMEPQKVVNFLNRFMTEMSRIIIKHEGIIDKFIGDNIMAIFIPGHDNRDDAKRAILTALEMKNQLKRLNREWKDAGLKIKIGTGINTGEVIVGNIGSEERMDYTVIGDNVNIAARLECIAKGGWILINESSYRDVESIVEAKKLKPFKVKNREGVIHAYMVKGMKK
jgi:class 3 adenylate cyclase